MTSVAVTGIDLTKRQGVNGILLGLLGRRGLKATELRSDSKYVLCLGAGELKLLTGSKFDDERGKFNPFKNKGLLFTTFHPAVVARNIRLMPLFRQDIELFVDIVKLDQGEGARL